MHPTTLVSGDTLGWVESRAAYPASAGWVLRLQLTGAAFNVAFVATASGDDHVFADSAATTSAWPPGTYRTTLTATLALARTTVESATLVITPNYAAGGNADTRSQARQALDNVNAMLASPGGVSAGISGYKIKDRELSRYSIAELLKLRQVLAAEVKAEQVAAGLATGGITKIYTRFTGVR